MSIKLKALGLSLLAAMAVSAVAVMNASANGSGHFETTKGAVIHGHVTHPTGGPHNLHLVNHGLEGEIGCDVQSYTATASASTITSITIRPKYETCYTTEADHADHSPNVPVHVNECDYTFTVAQGTTDNTEQTAHLVCPPGKKIEVTHPNCTVSVHPQTINTGLTYTTKGISNSHEITMHVNIQFTTTRHGLCQFIAPTNGQGTLRGSATVTATVNNVQVPLTAT